MDKQRKSTSFARQTILIIALSATVCVGGCILPIPTIPLNLPAHGHTYTVVNGDGEMTDEGIFIVNTYYHYHSDDRVDCYPIRNGQARLPYTTDVRVMPAEMFGYFSLVVPTYYIFFINAHHAHVYPFMPGHIPWNPYSPYIDDGEHIFGVKPRPMALRMYPVSPQAELEHLLYARGELQRYCENAGYNRKQGLASSYMMHNEDEDRKVLAYIDARIKALAEPPSLQDILNSTGPEEASKPIALSDKQRRELSGTGLGLSKSELAFRALEVDDNQLLKELLSSGLDPNAYGKGPWTLLHRAIDNGNLEAVKMLIEHGADVNRIMDRFAAAWYAFPYLEDRSKYPELDDGCSPLVLAAAGGHLEIVKLLQEHGARLQTSMCGSCQGLRCKHIGGKGYSCLHAATEAILDIHQIDSPGRYQTVEYLLKNGADVNQATESGFTPLHNAALSGFVRTADLLIKHGANVNARNGWGQTPLHLAAAKNNPAMCELLLRNGADANIRGNNDETPLSMAESIKDEEETHLWRTDTIELLKKACGEAVNVQAFADACRETRVSSQKFAFLGGRH